MSYKKSTCHKCKQKVASFSLKSVTTEQLEEDLYAYVTYPSAILSENDACWTVNIEIIEQ